MDTPVSMRFEFLLSNVTAVVRNTTISREVAGFKAVRSGGSRSEPPLSQSGQGVTVSNPTIPRSEWKGTSQR
jgi:hypothetical protein